MNKYIFCLGAYWSLAILLIFFTVKGDSQSVTNEEPCVLRGGSQGACVQVNACASYTRLLEDRRNTLIAIRFLNENACGMAKVCCPLEPKTDDVISKSVQEVDSDDFVSNFPEPPFCGADRSVSMYMRTADCTNVVLGVMDLLNGKKVDEDDSNWMARLGYKGPGPDGLTWQCGGSVITKRHVLTAAHCLKTSLYLFRVGHNDMDPAFLAAGSTVDYLIKKAIPHPNYYKYHNDIGVLVSKEQIIQFNKFVHPVCLPIPAKYKKTEVSIALFSDMPAMIEGWGVIENGTKPTNLRYTYVNNLDNQVCRDVYKDYNVTIDERVLCAGADKTDACEGDSGGPLLNKYCTQGLSENKFNSADFYYQRGIVSYGFKCKNSQYAGVYTSVEYFMPWITETVIGVPPPKTDIPEKKDEVEVMEPPTAVATTKGPIISEIRSASPTNKDPCALKDGSRGACMRLTACALYKRLLKDSSTTLEALRLIQENGCGFEENEAKVCCPEPSRNDVTPQPLEKTKRSRRQNNDFVMKFPEPPVCGEDSDDISIRTLDCGNKIVGGSSESPEYKGNTHWMALLGYQRRGRVSWECAGSIITTRHVLTAAHCVKQNLYLARVGQIEVSEDNGSNDRLYSVDHHIRKAITHEDYDGHVNNIAVLVMNEQIQFNEFVTPICLPLYPVPYTTVEVGFDVESAMIQGWRHIKNGTEPTYLEPTYVNNLEVEECWEHGFTETIDGRTLCAGASYADVCERDDTGGPFSRRFCTGGTTVDPDFFRDFHYQFGIVSYGYKCKDKSFTVVYTNVEYYMPWITEKVIKAPEKK